jgi:hypothetical protein
MQGCIITMLPAEYKVAVVKLTLKVWYQHAECNKLYCCRMMNEYLEGSGKPILESVKCDRTEHLKIIFHQTVVADWLRNHFIGLFQLNDFLNQGIRVVYVRTLQVMWFYSKCSQLLLFPVLGPA